MAKSPQSKTPSLPSLTSYYSDRVQKGLLTQKFLKSSLQEMRPALARQIAADAKRPELFQAWGNSSNIDAGAQTSTVNPLLLKELSAWAKQPFDAKTETANAGLLHTYGYLLSNLRTSFGYKRARWCNGNLERGLQLPKGYLSPQPKSGTLLSNVTCLMHTAFSDLHPTTLDPVAVDVSKLSGFTLIEELRDLPVTIYTRVLDFSLPPASPKDDCAALFYALKIENKFELITVFPVSSWMKGKIRKSAGKADARIKTRYNAVISLMGTEAHDGSTRLESWPPAP